MLCLAASVSLSSCIDETVPEDDYATTDQVGASSSALEASLNGIPTQMTEGYLVYKGEQVYGLLESARTYSAYRYGRDNGRNSQEQPAREP